MVLSISEEQLREYQDSGWQIQSSKATYEGRVYTLEQEDSNCCICVRTTRYAVLAPIVFAVTAAITIPLCALTYVWEMAKAAPRSETGMSEEEYHKVQEDLNRNQEKACQCMSDVCVLNSQLYEHLRPCETTVKIKLFVPELRTGEGSETSPLL